MIDSGAERARRSAALALLLGALSAPALAQAPPLGAPLRLAPPGAAQPAPAPSLDPNTALPRQTPPATDARPGGGDAVEVAPLGAVDPDTLGSRAPSGDAFAPTLWARTPRDVATVLLQRLPGAPTSAALRDLERRLLVAEAKPPEGTAPPGAPPLIALRIAKLLEMGETEAAAALLRGVPASIDEEPILRLRVEQALLGDKRDQACAQIGRQLPRFTNAFWQQAQVACQAAAGQDGPAGLGAQLLREQGVDNIAFFNLVELAAGTRNLPIDKLGPVTPTTLVLLRAAKHDVPADSLATTAPGVLRAIALAPEIPLASRLAAGERAAAFGALAPAALSELYLGVQAPPADIANAAALSRSDKSPRARALLYRAVHDQTDPTTRAELMRAALESARGAGLYAATTALYRPMIEELPPSAGLASFAPEAARALLLAGANDGARRWYDLARARGAAEGEAGRQQAQLWLLFRLAGLDDGGVEPARLLVWYDSQNPKPPAALAERASLAFGLLGALGDKVPSGAWLPLLVNPSETTRPVPATAILLELGSAATDGRLGEAVALAVTTIGMRDPAGAGTLACTGVTAALRGLNLAAAARRFALETMIAAGG
jgi:hypothetical protein